MTITVAEKPQIDSTPDMPTELFGIQATPPGEDGMFYHGSFHEIALLEWLRGVGALAIEADARDIEGQLACYSTHEELIHAIGCQDEQMPSIAIIAVDNNHSGRVVTAIEALRKEIGNGTVRIIGEIAIQIEQCILRHPDTPMSEIKQAISQLPALKQAHTKLSSMNIMPVERPDTVGSAVEVAEHKGMVQTDPYNKFEPAVPTVAIASSLAGDYLGLLTECKVSPADNVTRFMVITNKPEVYGYLSELETPNCGSCIISVPHARGGLLGAVRPFADAGINLLDIDCHLTPEANSTSFYVKVQLDTPEQVNQYTAILRQLEVKIGYSVTSLGTYTDQTIMDVKAAELRGGVSLTDPLEHFMGRDGGAGNDHNFVYVEQIDKPGSLASMLKVFDDLDISIKDMSRPRAAEKGRGRGFYFEVNKSDSLDTIVNNLREKGFTATAYELSS